MELVHSKNDLKSKNNGTHKDSTLAGLTVDCTNLACSNSRQQTHCIDSDTNMKELFWSQS